MNKVKKTRKKITALLLTGCLCVAMLGSYVLASTEYKVVSGDGGTYVKGSGEDYQLVIEGSMKDITGVEVDNNKIDPDQDCTITGEAPEETPTTEVPETTETPTTEVPETTEAPTTEVPETTEEPWDPTTEAPVYTTEPAVEPSEEPWDPTTEAPETWEPVYTSEAPSTWYPTTAEAPSPSWDAMAPVAAFFGAKQVQASTVTVTVTLKSSYLETLSVGTHEITVNFTDGSATATLNIEDPEATTADEDTTEEEDTTEATTADDGKGDSPDQTTTSNNAKTGDSTPIGIFLALAVCSGAVIVYFGRKKVTK